MRNLDIAFYIQETLFAFKAAHCSCLFVFNVCCCLFVLIHAYAPFKFLRIAPRPPPCWKCKTLSIDFVNPVDGRSKAEVERCNADLVHEVGCCMA